MCNFDIIVAKKNIISDFSALKGKVKLSEDSPGAEPAKIPKAEENRSSDRILKVGQKVVLMDSDMRGTIISLGRTVGIEVEDGFVIQAAYGEFALTDAGEISDLKGTKVRKKDVVAVPKKAWTSGGNHLSVDLHIEAIPGGRNVPQGQQLQFQIETFRRVIRENLHHKGMTITFIHGIGDGTLKAAIRKELDDVLVLRCTYNVGDPAVTTVTIK